MNYTTENDTFRPVYAANDLNEQGQAASDVTSEGNPLTENIMWFDSSEDERFPLMDDTYDMTEKLQEQRFVAFESQGKTYVASGFDVEDIINSLDDAENAREITAEEANQLSQPTLEEAKAAKQVEIITAANAMKASSSASFSALEEATWPQQEAGARKILNLTADVKDATAALLLTNEAATAAAVRFVEELAQTEKVSAQEFAHRIIANADAAYTFSIRALKEQRVMESAVKNATTVEEVHAVMVSFSVA